MNLPGETCCYKEGVSMKSFNFSLNIKCNSAVLTIALFFACIASGCSNMYNDMLKMKILFVSSDSTGDSNTVINDLSVSHYDSSSITLDKPTLLNNYKPAPAICAYIGLDNKITVTGRTVHDYIEGPIYVSENGYTFKNLSDRTRYRIIVVAFNDNGYTVKQTALKTRGSGLWTWVSGDNTFNQSGVYGARGIPAGANKPGARWQLVSWIDSSNNLWLFGGNGYDASGNQGYLNDLWKFDGTNWTWISGDNTLNQNGIYGTKGVAADSNKPGSRFRLISWTDSSGEFLAVRRKYRRVV